MMGLLPTSGIFVATAPVDLRKAFDGLAALVRQSLGHSLGSQEDWQRALALFQECEAHPEREQTSRKFT